MDTHVSEKSDMFGPNLIRLDAAFFKKLRLLQNTSIRGRQPHKVFFSFHSESSQQQD